MNRTLRTVSTALAALAIAAAGGIGAEERWKIVHAGHLIVDPLADVLVEHTLVVHGERIHAIEAGFRDLAALGIDGDARIVDLRNAWVLPGLIDGHVHLTVQYGGVEPVLESWATLPPDTESTGAELALNGAVYARRTLEAGFTTVRDVGALGGAPASEAVFALREAIDAGRLPGPRMVVAGAPISATGGHGDHAGLREDVREAVISPGLCDGVESCRRAVRQQVARGAGVIKVMATGGGREPTGGPDAAPEFSDEELRTIVATAHDLGVKTTAHAHGHQGMRAAIDAGIDSIEHGSFATREVHALMRARGVALLPTLTVQSKRLHVAARLPPEQRAPVEADVGLITGNFVNAVRAGVPVVLGTDAGMFPHGWNARELQWYVELGMTAPQALASATTRAATLLGVDQQVGTLEPGKRADLIAVIRDPLADIRALQSVGFVMKGGIVYRHDAGTPSPWSQHSDQQ